MGGVLPLRVGGHTVAIKGCPACMWVQWIMLQTDEALCMHLRVQKLMFHPVFCAAFVEVNRAGGCWCVAGVGIGGGMVRGWGWGAVSGLRSRYTSLPPNPHPQLRLNNQK